MVISPVKSFTTDSTPLGIHSFTPLQGFTPLSPFRDSLLPVVHPNMVIQYNHENPK